MSYTRRRYIVLGGTIVTGSLAGCVGDDSEDGDNTADDSEDGNNTADDGEDGDNTADGSNGDGNMEDGDDEMENGDDEMEDGETEEETASPPADDTDPSELLPDPPDGWEQTEIVEQSQSSLDSIGAEAGIGAFYTDPDGGEYFVEITRWPSESDSESGWEEVYSEGPSWIVYVASGNFSFAANGPDSTDVEGSIVTLLSNSPPLTEEFITGNDKAEDRG